MEPEVSSIRCPQCGATINVSDVLFHQIEEGLKQDFQKQISQKDKEYEEKNKAIQKAQNEVKKAQEDFQAKVDEAVKQNLSEQKSAMEKTIRQKINEETAQQIQKLEEENRHKSEQVKELNTLRVTVSQLQREKDEMRGAIEAELSENFNQKLATATEKIQQNEAGKILKVVQEKDKLIDDLTKKADDLTRRLESGSNKQTGEIAELVLRDFLKASFPLDEISDVPSGLKGADVVQNVRNSMGQASGCILFERKETQNWSDGWIEKLKLDGRTAKADVLVILSKTMPKDNQNSHFRDGVWVCHFDDLLLLTTLLRDGLIKQYAALTSQADKGTKMEWLYSYLLSNDFKNHILGILDSFRKMDKALAKEKEDTTKRLAERDAHIWQAKQSVLSFYHRIEGIASDSLNEQMKMLNEGAEQGKLEE